jgi:uncharacterized membrane protein YfcA
MTCLLASQGHRLVSQGTHFSNNVARGVRRQAASKSGPQQSEGGKFDIPAAFTIGGVAGALGSLAGMGGGFVMIPLMTSGLLRLSQHQAHGTSLFAVAATGLAGAVSYSEHVQVEEAATVAIFGVMTARLGAQMTTKLSEKFLKRALGVLVLAMAPAVPLKAYILEKHAADQLTKVKEDTTDLPTAQRFLPPAAIGLASGFLSGMFGVGGGAVVVPALTIASDMNHYQALATSLAAMTLPAIVGTVTHARAGNVAFRVAPALAMGAATGAFMGGQLGLKMDEITLRWGFSGLLAALGARTLLKV